MGGGGGGWKTGFLKDGKGAGQMGGKGEGTKKDKLFVTEYSQGCKVQCTEHSQEYCHI